MSLPLVVLSLLLLADGSLGQNDTSDTGSGQLMLPNPKDCANRIKHANVDGHNYFFSWEYELTKELKVTFGLNINSDL